jgi:hypothetical protein
LTEIIDLCYIKAKSERNRMNKDVERQNDALRTKIFVSFRVMRKNERLFRNASLIFWKPLVTEKSTLIAGNKNIGDFECHQR